MARLAAQQRRRRQIQAGIGGAVALILVALGTTWALGGFSHKSSTQTLPTCTWTPRDTGSGVESTGLPPTDAPTAGVKVLTLTTDHGNISAVLDVANAHCGIASVQYLTGLSFYNNTKCHKLDTTNRVLTCGSKTGDDTSSPGYQFPTEGLPRTPLGTASPAPTDTATAAPNSYYAKGSVLLANVGDNAVGSQLMIVYDDNTPLPASYTQIGTIDAGLDIVSQIAAAGAVDSSGAAAAVGKPNQTLTITGATVTDQLSQLTNPPGAPSNTATAAPTNSATS
jgi:peptidyl-prolyl cis-trans isomerase B (cyclophilin B)